MVWEARSPQLLRVLSAHVQSGTRGHCVLLGEKLDYKACEALEEVFKRLQFRVVDLEQTSLDEDVSSPGLPDQRLGWGGDALDKGVA